MTSQRLYRSETDRILGGVCGGIGEVYDTDPTLVRLVTIILIFSGLSPLIYLIAWLIIPTESEVKGENKSSDSEEVTTTEDAEKEDEEDNFECGECGREFDSKRGLSVHQAQKH